MSDKRDEIISMQLDLIRSMAENNMRRIGSDFWGTPTPKKEEKKPSDVPPVSADTPKTADKTAEKSTESTEEKLPEKENIDDLRAELDDYIGLERVKAEVKNLINIAAVYQMRREHDLPVADMSLHMVFSGNPGTGKTMIARFMARVYHSLGILSKGQLVEVDRSGLVAGYVGQTAIKTAKVLEKAKGGVLFIDEAYTLTSKEGNDFGYEAVDTVLKFMEDNRDDIVVIVAGYTELMEKFIDSNPGLQSRFNKYLLFDDYTAEEMLGIFRLQCEKNCYTLDGDAEKETAEYLKMASEAAGEFGNARGVRNVFEKILTAQANRLAVADKITREELMRITKEDVRIAAYGKEDLPADGNKENSDENP
ncbi:MAG: AAA family ATPase [Ruminococcaceae bacterium]|nr:AAA family ATPase [Oscillospiraceae bacterium]